VPGVAVIDRRVYHIRLNLCRHGYLDRRPGQSWTNQSRYLVKEVWEIGDDMAQYSILEISRYRKPRRNEMRVTMTLSHYFAKMSSPKANLENERVGIKAVSLMKPLGL